MNAQVLAVAASPDGSRIYVGGDFTTANGASRSRIAAYDVASGSLISTFAPNVGYQVRAIVATNTTVYVGGSFAGVGSATRGNLAAFNAANGALLPWAPSADSTVSAITLTPDGTAVITGGTFQNVNGTPAYGLAKISTPAGALPGGALMPWNATQVVQDAGKNAGITSLSTSGGHIYGTGYVFGAGGNLEGMFQADPTTGNITEMEDCHGDTYSSLPRVATSTL